MYALRYAPDASYQKQDVSQSVLYESDNFCCTFAVFSRVQRYGGNSGALLLTPRRS